MAVDRENQSDTPPTTSCASATCSDQPSTPTPRRKGRGGQAGRGRGVQVGRGRGKEASSTASLEIRPTGFAKCDGCNRKFYRTFA